METLVKHLSYIPYLNLSEWLAWLCAVLSFLVSLLTLYNAAKLKTGILAVSTYAFGAGMLALSVGFLFLATPDWATPQTVNLLYRLSFILGFALLGFGSYKIYKMAKI